MEGSGSPRAPHEVLSRLKRSTSALLSEVEVAPSRVVTNSSLPFCALLQTVESALTHGLYTGSSVWDCLQMLQIHPASNKHLIALGKAKGFGDLPLAEKSRRWILQSASSGTLGLSVRFLMGADDIKLAFYEQTAFLAQDDLAQNFSECWDQLAAASLEVSVLVADTFMFDQDVSPVLSGPSPEAAPPGSCAPVGASESVASDVSLMSAQSEPARPTLSPLGAGSSRPNRVQSSPNFGEMEADSPPIAGGSSAGSGGKLTSILRKRAATIRSSAKQAPTPVLDDESPSARRFFGGMRARASSTTAVEEDGGEVQQLKRTFCTISKEYSEQLLSLESKIHHQGVAADALEAALKRHFLLADRLAEGDTEEAEHLKSGGLPTRVEMKELQGQIWTLFAQAVPPTKGRTKEDPLQEFKDEIAESNLRELDAKREVLELRKQLKSQQQSKPKRKRAVSLKALDGAPPGEVANGEQTEEPN